MDIKSVLGFMDKAIDIAKSVKPLGELMDSSLFSKVAGWTSVAVEVGQNAIARADDVKLIISGSDVVEINKRIVELDALNTELHQQVLDS